MKKIYLDGAANTPIDRDVLKAMRPFLSTKFVGNSMSIHDFGIYANKAIDVAREQIATDICVEKNEVYFTSGATESNNWAIKSCAMEQFIKKHTKGHIICSATEHDSVLKCCKQLEDFGFTVTFIKPEDKARIRLKDVTDALRDDTFLICVMAVNNETGSENSINAIAEFAKTNNIKILVDCTQLLGFGGEAIEIGRRYPSVNFFTFSSHKLYGPTGAGCLIARNTELFPLIIGGEQESALRGGTSNTAGIIGTAAAIHKMRKNDYAPYFNTLFTKTCFLLKKNLPGVSLNVHPDHFNILSINCSRVVNTDNLANILASYGVAVSAGSACDSQHDETAGEFNGSHVLKELGLSENEIKNTIRVSFTKYTKLKDIKGLIKALKQIKEVFPNNG